MPTTAVADTHRAVSVSPSVRTGEIKGRAETVQSAVFNLYSNEVRKSAGSITNGGGNVGKARLTLEATDTGYMVRVQILETAPYFHPKQKDFRLTIPKASDSFHLEPDTLEFGHVERITANARLGAVLEDRAGERSLNFHTFMVRRDDGGLQNIAFRKLDGSRSFERERQFTFPVPA